MDKKLFQTRKEIYGKCPSIYWEVSIFVIIVAIALVALEAVIPGSYLITFPVLFFPALFATYMTLFTIKFGGTVTIKSTFGIARSYYNRNNFGSFSIIRNFLHAFLVEILASMVIGLISFSIFSSIYGSLFVDNVNQLFEIANTNAIEQAEYILTETPVALYIDSTAAFSTSCSILAFIFGIAFNSMKVYLCTNIPNATAQISNSIFARFLRSHRKSYRKDFWSLNWPVFVLIPIGMVIGYTLIFMLDIEFTYALPISTMVGLLCLIPFAPFYFAGMEALFAKYIEMMKQASVDMTTGFLKNLLNNPNISDEDKKQINDLLSKGKNENKDDNNCQG